MANAGAPNPELETLAHEREAKLTEALHSLRHSYREAVILRDLQDMDYKEIAKALRVPEGTVKSRINRGRIELAHQLRRLQENQPVRPRRRGARSI